MKILQLCFRMPYPLKDGGAIAMYNMTKAFWELGCNTTLLVPVTPKHNVSIEDLPDDFKKLAQINTVKVNSEITFASALKNLLFSKMPYYISRYENENFRRKLIRILKEEDFDIVHIESLKEAIYVEDIRKHSKAKIVMRSHNIEYKIWERMASSTHFGLKKIYLNILVKRLKKYEIGTLNTFDAIVPITKVDGDFFIKAGCTKPVFPTASGIEMQRFEDRKENPQQISLFHIGALDWMPNMEAVNWFINDIWPKINIKFPDLKFYIAGRNMPEKIKKLNKKNIEIVGEVNSAIDFMNSKSVMIVPLLSGSGMRIKIVEGMALGKVIISTSIGAEGIEYTDEENILIADSKEEFVNRIEQLINDNAFAKKISNNAVELVKNKYDNLTIVKKLLNNYKKVIAK
ncbi:MAG: glycosyltransferase family 4 protein [Bacteroidota bacterium]|nr:glycosyltransferase family 4 protein [Bacteroidota bacterium]